MDCARRSFSMADNDLYDRNHLAVAYGRFSVRDPAHRVALQTKVNARDPRIRNAFKAAAAGRDAVSDEEMTVLAGRQTRAYRSNLLNMTNDLRQLLGTSEAKIVFGRDAATAAQEQEEQIRKLAQKTGLDEKVFRDMVRDYEAKATADTKAFTDSFGGPPPTALKSEIGRELLAISQGKEP